MWKWSRRRVEAPPRATTVPSMDASGRLAGCVAAGRMVSMTLLDVSGPLVGDAASMVALSGLVAEVGWVADAQLCGLAGLEGSTVNVSFRMRCTRSPESCSAAAVERPDGVLVVAGVDVPLTVSFDLVGFDVHPAVLPAGT